MGHTHTKSKQERGEQKERKQRNVLDHHDGSDSKGVGEAFVC